MIRCNFNFCGMLNVDSAPRMLELVNENSALVYLQKLNHYLREEHLTLENQHEVLPRLDHAALILQNTEFSLEARIQAAELLAHRLTDEFAIDCFGVPHQPIYFAIYAIDLQLNQLNTERTPARETRLRRLINSLLNTISPHQRSFDISGTTYTREQLTELAERIRIGGIPATPALAPTQTAIQTEQQMKGQGDRSTAQNVHSRAVRSAGSLVLNRMRSAIPNNQLKSSEEAQKHFLATLPEIIRSENITRKTQNMVVSNQVSQSAARNGLTNVMNATRADTEWNENISPRDLFALLWSYITANSVDTTRHTLSWSLVERLCEISREDPCVTGLLQRLLDVPTIIDPQLNAYGQVRQIENDVRRIAFQVYENIATEIDAEADRMRGMGQPVDSNVVVQIKKSLFRNRVEVELKQMENISAEFLDDFILREEAAFGF